MKPWPGISLQCAAVATNTPAAVTTALAAQKGPETT